MRFNPDLLELVPVSQLDADFGGENYFQFDAGSYWDQIVAYVPSFLLTLFPFQAFGHSPISNTYLDFNFSACDIRPDGTRSDCPPTESDVPSSNTTAVSSDKDSDSGTVHDTEEELTLVQQKLANMSTSDSPIDQKTKTKVCISEASVDADDGRAVLEPVV